MRGSGVSRARMCTGPAEQGWGPDGSAGGAGRHAPFDQNIPIEKCGAM